MQSRLDYDGIAVSVSTPDGLETIHCNAHQIEQIILNFISNSRHALNEKFPKGSHDKKNDILASEVESGGKYLKLDFTDNGSGIPGDVLPKITAPFFTTKEPGIGTGLGLSICQDIINLHGGTFDVQSKHGEYTKISIALPYGLD